MTFHCALLHFEGSQGIGSICYLLLKILGFIFTARKDCVVRVLIK